MSGPLLGAVRDEIVALHDAFVGWFGGATAAGDAHFEAAFGHRFAQDFTLIPPAGVVLSLDTLTAGLRRGHGLSPGFRIAIRDVVLVTARDEVVVATYTEWQRNARNSTPPDNGRRATVVFHRDGDRLRWRHVHETWLPVEVVAAFDFAF